MSSLAVRHREPELMDDPNLAPELHQQALAGLGRVHLVSGTVSTLWSPICRLAQRSHEPLRVLDVACGGGEVAIALARRAIRLRVATDISGCDISQTALDYASARAATDRANVHFFQADAISAPFPRDYDIVYCSLFLHHLDEGDAVKLLISMQQAAKQMVLVNDLVRSRLGYLMTWCGVRILTRSRVCHIDGPLSVRAAFTPKEVLELAKRAGLHSASLTRHWPQRFMLEWSRS